MSAPNTTVVSTTPGCTMPLPMVAATCSPKTKYAMTLKAAANATAVVGRSTPVDTTVAIEFAASWKPFMKSKASASATRTTTTHRAACAVCMRRLALRMLEDDALDHVGHVFALVRDGLEQLVDR